jgi:hypothetical protein
LAGKAGERIQISSGTVAMRLTVMELGRFMGPIGWAEELELCASGGVRLPHLFERRMRGRGAAPVKRADTSILPQTCDGEGAFPMWAGVREPRG